MVVSSYAGGRPDAETMVVDSQINPKDKSAFGRRPPVGRWPQRSVRTLAVFGLMLPFSALISCSNDAGPPTTRSARPPNAAAAAMVGRPAPDFLLRSLEGEEVRLSTQRGRVVILDLWATWCGPCRRIMPFVHRTALDFEKRGVVAYAVNQGESAEAVRTYLDGLEDAPKVLMDPRGQLAAAFKVEFVPLTVVVDAQGRVAAALTGLTPLHRNLRPTLAKLTAPQR